MIAAIAAPSVEHEAAHTHTGERRDVLRAVVDGDTAARFQAEAGQDDRLVLGEVDRVDDDAVAVGPVLGGVERLGGQSLQIRPWLQDFDLFGMTPYGPEQVRAQIEAANEHGTSGWMLWDPENRFRVENLDRATESDVPNPENVG